MIQIMRSFISGCEEKFSGICSNDVDREEFDILVLNLNPMLML